MKYGLKTPSILDFQSLLVEKFHLNPTFNQYKTLALLHWRNFSKVLLILKIYNFQTHIYGEKNCLHQKVGGKVFLFSEFILNLQKCILYIKVYDFEQGFLPFTWFARLWSYVNILSFDMLIFFSPSVVNQNWIEQMKKLRKEKKKSPLFFSINIHHSFWRGFHILGITAFSKGDS